MSKFTEQEWRDAVLERRYGEFRIERQLIEAHPAIVAEAMANVIVFRAELRYNWDGIEYHALSPMFAPTKRASMPEPYAVVVDQQGGAVVGIHFASTRGTTTTTGGRDVEIELAARQAP